MDKQELVFFKEIKKGDMFSYDGVAWIKGSNTSAIDFWTNESWYVDPETLVRPFETIVLDKEKP